MKAYFLEQDADCPEGECPLCGCSIEPPGSLVECPACHTFYHLDCWHFSGDRCGRFGCRGQAEITGVIRAPAFVAKPAPGMPLLRLHPAEIARAVRQRGSGSSSPIPWIWRGPIRSALFAAGGSLLVSWHYLLVKAALLHTLGEAGFADSFGLPFLSRIGEWASSHWLLAGLLYGICYHRHLMLREANWQKLARFLITMLVLCPLCFQLGHLLFLPSRLASNLLWGLSAKVLWLAPIAAWAGLITAVLCAIGTFSERISLYLLTFGFTVTLVILAIPSYISMTSSGLFFGGIFWILGSIVDLLWRGHHIGALLGSWGLAFGGSVGFLSGAVSAIRKMNERSSN